jgi:hypothetical protein
MVFATHNEAGRGEENGVHFICLHLHTVQVQLRFKYTLCHVQSRYVELEIAAQRVICN